MGNKTAVCILILLSSLLLSCGEFAGWSSADDEETGDLEDMNLYLGDDEFETLYNSIVIDESAYCRYNVDGYTAEGYINIRGLTSRMLPKKSFTLEKTDETKWALDGGGDPWFEYALAMKAYQLAGLPVSDFTAVALYLNGSYLGYYNIISLYNDDLNDHYGASSSGELFKICLDDFAEDTPIWGDSEKKFPDDEDFSLLSRLFVNVRNMDSDDWVEWIEENTDMDEIARYMAVMDFFSVSDTSRLNFYIYFYDERAVILPWDNDRGFNYSDIGGNNLLTERMLESETFQELYKYHFNRLFLVDGDENILDDLQDYLDELSTLLDASAQVEPAYFLEYSAFLEEIDFIGTFLEERPADILSLEDWADFF